MNRIQLGNIIPIYRMNDVCIDRLVEKVSRSQRRKNNFGEYGNGHSIRKRHWNNHAGTYRDENCKAPKYYQPNIPQKRHSTIPIRTHVDLIKALKQIAAGRANHDHYTGVTGINRERLRYTQSIRDKKERVSPYEIARMGYAQMKRK